MAEGDPLVNVIEHGISRIKHASDCVAVLLKELKLQADAGSFRLFYAVDLVNSFYRPTNMMWPDKTGLHVDQITIGRAFKKLLLNDWVRIRVLIVSSNRIMLLQSLSLCYACK
jgi:small subunit ribosomal protein S29